MTVQKKGKLTEIQQVKNRKSFRKMNKEVQSKQRNLKLLTWNVRVLYGRELDFIMEFETMVKIYWQ